MGVSHIIAQKRKHRESKKQKKKLVRYIGIIINKARDL